jgi:hypothetical protein
MLGEKERNKNTNISMAGETEIGDLKLPYKT